MNKYRNHSKEQLILHIEALEKQLKSTKYGLYWDKDVEPEYAIEKIKKNIPVLNKNSDLTIINDNSDLNHLILEGDNYDVLTALNMISNGKGFVDIIYIDPPYNTGNKDFIYNDSFVDKEDGYRHSKWLNFMEKRLILARELLNEDGVIFMSIDDNEQANLELLANSIFGESNLITKFIWEKTQHFGRQKINYYSNCEYVLCYAKNIYDNKNLKLKELLVEKFNNELQDAPLYNASNPKKTLVFPPNSVYINLPDGEYCTTTVDKYKLIKPVIVKNKKNTNELVLEFQSRWSADTVINEYNKGTTFWVKTQSFAIRTIYHEGKISKTSPKQIIFTNSNNPLVSKSRFGNKVGVNDEASRELKNIFGENVFSYPKPVSLIKYLISLYFDYEKNEHKKSLSVLDFFAGSGTTGQAVLELNQEDGANRQFILVTNNENNICTDVTYPRLKTVITGIRPDGTKYSDGIPANLHYYKTDFIPNVNNRDQAKYNLVERCNELMCIVENTYNELENNEKYSIYENNSKTKRMFLYTDFYEEKSFNEFRSKVLESSVEAVVYIFSTDNVIDETLFDKDSKVEVKPIPNKIYEIYKEIIEGIKRG